MFSALLLVDTTAPAPVHPYLLYAMSLGGLLFGVYTFFRRESAESRAKRELAVTTRDERIKALENLVAHHEIRFTGVVGEHARHCDEVLVRFTAHEHRLAEIPPIRESMVEVRSQIKYMSEGFSKLEQKIDRLIERLTK